MYMEMKAAVKGAILDPTLILSIVTDAVRLRLGRSPVRVKTLVGTHHKILTVYMTRVFRAFSVITGQTFSISPHVEYDKEVLVDYHSKFEFGRVTVPFRGVHVRRDPRDVLVSCVLYHLKSSESWLHREGGWGFQGSTYQKELRALKSMEEQLLFELDRVGGRVIEQMTSWDYSRPEFVELRYEGIVGEDGLRYIRESLDQSALFDANECAVIVNLFKIFSMQGVLAKKGHIRDPRPSQWKEHFTPAVERRFYERFGQALEKLGYDGTATT
jgi:hypothetical protein